jgi:hypothetical protein
MKTKTLTVAASLAFLLFGSAQASPFASLPKPGIVGTLSSDGSFHPFVRRGPMASPAAATTVTGTLSLALSISVATNLSSKTTILCTLEATVLGSLNGTQNDTIIESGTVAATVNGAKATCTPKIPYEWHLVADTGGAVERDSVSLSYQINEHNGAGVGRTSDVSFATLAVPKNGKTTSYSVDARI